MKKKTILSMGTLLILSLSIGLFMSMTTTKKTPPPAQFVSQEVYRTAGSYTCAEEEFTIALLVSYQLRGNFYSVLSNAKDQDDIPVGTTTNLSIGIPLNAVITSKKIKVTGVNHSIVHDLGDNSISYYYTQDWLGCSGVFTGLDINDTGSDFDFGFGIIQ